jgi:hypothetical protein
MSRYLLTIILLTLALFVVTAIVPTFYPTDNTTAYAQIGKGKRPSGGDKTEDKPSKPSQPSEPSRPSQPSQPSRQNNNDSGGSKNNNSGSGNSSNSSSETTLSERTVIIKPVIKDRQSDSPTNTAGNGSERLSKNNSDTSNNQSGKIIDRNPKINNRSDDKPTNNGDKILRTGERPEEPKRRNRHSHEHPYDWYYPYYEPEPTVIVVYPDSYPHDSWPTQSNISAQEVVNRIGRAWLDRQPDLLLTMLPDPDIGELIDVYRNDEYLRSMEPGEFFNLTSQAIREFNTTKFKLDVKKQTWDTIEARGIHEYKTIDNNVERKDVIYTLNKRNNRWVITSTGYYEPEVDNPLLRALINSPNIRQTICLMPLMMGNGLPDHSALSIMMVGALIPLAGDELQAISMSERGVVDR